MPQKLKIKPGFALYQIWGLGTWWRTQVPDGRIDNAVRNVRRNMLSKYGKYEFLELQKYVDGNFVKVEFSTYFIK